MSEASKWELRSPTHASEPQMVLHMLDGARKMPDYASPSQRSSSHAAARERAIAEVAAARELGIPAAVSVPGATQRPTTGMLASVDGSSGVATVLETSAVPPTSSGTVLVSAQ